MVQNWQERITLRHRMQSGFMLKSVPHAKIPHPK
jgi:hypothetical protein